MRCGGNRLGKETNKDEIWKPRNQGGIRKFIWEVVNVLILKPNYTIR